jgi:hypothetical protein
MATRHVLETVAEDGKKFAFSKHTFIIQAFLYALQVEAYLVDVKN